MITKFGQPIGGSSAKMRPKKQRPTLPSRQAEQQVRQPQEPFRNPNSVVNSPAPRAKGRVEYSAPFDEQSHGAGRNGEPKGTDLTHDEMLALGYSERPKGHSEATDIRIRKLKQKYSGIYGSSASY
jgi:hypothetical protein